MQCASGYTGTAQATVCSGTSIEYKLMAVLERVLGHQLPVIITMAKVIPTAAELMVIKHFVNKVLIVLADMSEAQKLHCALLLEVLTPLQAASINAFDRRVPKGII